jgi:hypothetical protein
MLGLTPYLLTNRVANSHNFNADPDPSFHRHADPDPDPAFTQMRIRIRLPKIMGIHAKSDSQPAVIFTVYRTLQWGRCKCIICKCKIRYPYDATLPYTSPPSLPPLPSLSPPPHRKKRPHSMLKMLEIKKMTKGLTNTVSNYVYVSFIQIFIYIKPV